MYVIGTAGHVDHGKSTLVKALTGIDPDRLREEKERGLTIDLGFAWLTLPSGREVSIVDVPGHERFIKNMLAGVGGIDLALLVVAADEAVMPQTREHLAILDLLRVRRGMAVIAKRDLVDDDWLELVKVETEDLLKDTTLEGAPIVAASAITSDGLEDLKHTLDQLLEETEPRKDLGRPRLAIDRSFIMTGFGTVVTGTLIDGTLSIGQEVELVPSGKRSRIRGLQTHRHKMQQAVPGSRVAVNLTGISHEEVHRGEVLTTPGWLKPTLAVDAHLRLLDAAPRPLRHNGSVTLHTGASETPARVRLLNQDELLPGQDTWVQLRLKHPVALVKGDYFVIRSSATTMGGGNIVEPYARRHRRRHMPTLERLMILEQGSDVDVVASAVEEIEPCDLSSLARRANLSLEETQRLTQDLVTQGRLVPLAEGKLRLASFLYTARGWNTLVERARKTLEAYHRQYPLRKGIPKEELRSRLGLSAQLFPLALQRWTKDSTATEEGPYIRLPYHQLRLTEAQRKSIEEYVAILEQRPFSPSTDSLLEPDLLNLLVEETKVIKVSDNVAFSTSAYQEMVERIVAHIRAQGNITVAEVRDMFNTSRKYALALMEHLDQRHITRRVGDERVLR